MDFPIICFRLSWFIKGIFFQDWGPPRNYSGTHTKYPSSPELRISFELYFPPKNKQTTTSFSLPFPSPQFFFLNNFEPEKNELSLRYTVNLHFKDCFKFWQFLLSFLHLGIAPNAKGFAA